MLNLIQAVFNSKILDKYSYHEISDVLEKLLINIITKLIIS